MARVSRKRTGPGEIVPSWYEQEAAQHEFFAVLWELVPESIAPLVEIYSLLLSQTGGKVDLRSVLPMMTRWQRDFRLENLEGADPWLHLPALEGHSELSHPVSIYEGRDFDRNIDVRDGAIDKFQAQSRYVKRNGMIRGSNLYAVSLAHLLYDNPEEGTEGPEDAAIGEFDPRAETVDQATARLMPALQRRLQHGLEGIVKKDSTLGRGVPARSLPSRKHFEWTVRYQVIGETYARIAASDDIGEARTVSNAVRAVAKLIGLTLRERDKGGRPPNPVPARSSRTIAIPNAGKTPVTVNDHN